MVCMAYGWLSKAMEPVIPIHCKMNWNQNSNLLQDASFHPEVKFIWFCDSHKQENPWGKGKRHLTAKEKLERTFCWGGGVQCCTARPCLKRGWGGHKCSHTPLIKMFSRWWYLWTFQTHQLPSQEKFQQTRKSCLMPIKSKNKIFLTSLVILLFFGGGNWGCKDFSMIQKKRKSELINFKTKSKHFKKLSML